LNLGHSSSGGAVVAQPSGCFLIGSVGANNPRSGQFLRRVPASSGGLRSAPFIKGAIKSAPVDAPRLKESL